MTLLVRCTKRSNENWIKVEPFIFKILYFITRLLFIFGNLIRVSVHETRAPVTNNNNDDLIDDNRAVRSKNRKNGLDPISRLVGIYYYNSLKRTP